MKRDHLKVYGITSDDVARLQAVAQLRFGKPNAALLVRHLIAECLAAENLPAYGIDISGESERIELRLPRNVVQLLESKAEQRLSPRNYYICSLIYKHLGQDQLQGDEIETLRRSNYELAKVGTNINQIAKAFNLLVVAGGGGKLPEIGKKMASLRLEIKKHTATVLRVLEAKTVLWETRVGKRGSNVTRSRNK